MNKNLRQLISTWLLLVVAFAGFQAKAYDEMYVIGTLCSWDLGNHVAMTKSGDVFTYTGNFPDSGDGYSWFSFTSSSSTDWNTVNSNRFGPATNGTVATVGTNSVTGTGDVSFKITPGGYTLSFDTSTNTLTISTATIETKYYLAGSFTSPAWADGKLEMTKSGDSYSVTVPNVASGGEFKIIKSVGGTLTWLGGETNDDQYVVHDAWCTDIALSESGKNFRINGTGNLTFTVTNDALSVSGWGALESSLTLKGTFDSWGAGEAMTKNGDGSFTITKAMDAEAEFKFVDQNGNWKGVVSDGKYWVTEENMSSGSHTISMDTEGEGQNIYMVVAGTWTITVSADLSQVTIAGDWVNPEEPVVVASGITNGTVTVDKSVARAGNVVTITVTPATGYYAENANITVEKTVASGSAQAPQRAPAQVGVGDFVTVSGTAVASAGEATTYTFIMPEAPKGALVSVEFQQCTTLTADMFEDIDDQDWTGEQVQPDVTPVSPLTTDGFTVTGYGTNTDEGAGSVTVTGRGKYTGTVTLPFTIAKATHNVIIDANIQNGSVTANPMSGIVGTTITLSNTPASGYEFLGYTVTDANGNPVENNGSTFVMPNSDAYVTASFGHVPEHLYLKGSFDGWSDGLEFTHNQDGSWTLTAQLAKQVEFKVNDSDNTWYQHAADSDGNYWVTEVQLGTPIPLTTTTDMRNLYIDVAGEWTFTVNAARTTLTVTGPWGYNVTVDSDVASYVNAPSEKQYPNETVNLTVNNTVDYVVTAITATDAAGNPVTVNNDNGNYSFTMPYSNVTVTATVTYLDLYLTGSFNNWIGSENVALSDTYKFTTQQDGSHTLTLQLPKEIEFKVVDNNNTWRGAAGEWDIYESQVTNPDELDLGGEYNFSMPVAGEWTFTVNAARDKLTITGPWGYTVSAAQGSASYVTVPSEKQFPNETVTFSVNAQQGMSVAYVIAQAGSDVLTLTNNGDGTYSFTMPYADVVVTAMFDNTKYKLTLGTGCTADVANVNEVLAGTPVTITVAVSNPTDFKAVDLTLVATADGVSNPTATLNADGTFTFNMPMSDVTVSAVIEAILHGVTFDADRQWATYYGAYSLELPDGVQAFIATELNSAGDALAVQELNFIPKNCGVLLYSTTAMTDITTPLYDDGTQTTSNTGMLVGSVDDTEMTAGYVLYNNIFLRTEGGDLAAHRCYLPQSSVPSGAPRRLSIVLPHQTVVTGIEGIDASDVVSVKYVNLQGMSSDKPFKGVNIVVITKTDGSTKTVKVLK